MRYCMLHSIEVAGAALIFIKLMLLSDTVMNCAFYVFYVAKLLFIHGIFIFQAIFIRDQINAADKSSRKYKKA